MVKLEICVIHELDYLALSIGNTIFLYLIGMMAKKTFHHLVILTL